MISEVISEYNKMRSPEATASLAKLEGRKALIRFSGAFCMSCGVADYFEDFVIEAENQNLRLAIKSIQQIDDENYLVEFEEVVR